MPLTLGPSVKLGVPVILFDTDAAPFNAGVNLTTYDVAPDGRFLMLRSVASEATATPRHVLIQNWRGAAEE